MNATPEITPAEKLPKVPQWWWDYGLNQELAKRQREGAAFDEKIAAGSSDL